jgi:hypothetical protein
MSHFGSRVEGTFDPLTVPIPVFPEETALTKELFQSVDPNFDVSLVSGSNLKKRVDDLQGLKDRLQSAKDNRIKDLIKVLLSGAALVVSVAAILFVSTIAVQAGLIFPVILSVAFCVGTLGTWGDKPRLEKEVEEKNRIVRATIVAVGIYLNRYSGKLLDEIEKRTALLEKEFAQVRFDQMDPLDIDSFEQGTSKRREITSKSNELKAVQAALEDPLAADMIQQLGEGRFLKKVMSIQDRFRARRVFRCWSAYSRSIALSSTKMG